MREERRVAGPLKKGRQSCPAAAGRWRAGRSVEASGAVKPYHVLMGSIASWIALETARCAGFCDIKGLIRRRHEETPVFAGLLNGLRRRGDLAGEFAREKDHPAGEMGRLFCRPSFRLGRVRLDARPQYFGPNVSATAKRIFLKRLKLTRCGLGGIQRSGMKPNAIILQAPAVTMSQVVRPPCIFISIGCCA